MENILHSCDISNPARRTRIYLLWTDRVLSEFFNQGDREQERGFAISNFMDRETTNIAKMQIGFINFVVTPLYQALEHVLPAAAEPVGWLGLNRQFWEQRTEEMEEQMKTCQGKYKLPVAEDIPDDEIKAILLKHRNQLTTVNKEDKK